MDKKSLKTFGLIWSLIFFTIAAYPILKSGDLRVWALAVSIVFLAISLLYPKLYQITHFYQSWIKFGEFIGKINSKIIIFILFYFLFLPMGIILKLLKKDLLKKQIDQSAISYFIDRKDQPKNMENQF